MYRLLSFDRHLAIDMRLLNYFAPGRDRPFRFECSSLMNFQTSTHRSAWLLTADELVCCQSCIDCRS
jgi:hypothetical protein